MRSYTWKNQSLIGVSNRLLRHVDADAASAPDMPIYVNFAELKFSTVNAVVVCIALALGLLLSRKPQPACETARYSIEFALLLLLILMVTPLSFGYFTPAHAAVCGSDGTSTTGKHLGILWWSLPALALLGLGLIFPAARSFTATIFCHAAAVYRPVD